MLDALEAALRCFSETFAVGGRRRQQQSRSTTIGESAMNRRRDKVSVAKPESPDLPADARRLLRALAGDGACGRMSDDGGNPRVSVSVRRNNISICAAHAVPAAAQALCQADLAEWIDAGGSGRRLLMLTAAGRARLTREGAEAGADPFLAQHRPLERRRIDDGNGTAVRLVDTGESPLAWLAGRKDGRGRPLIEPVLLEAGERLRRDLTLAQMLPRMSANWSATAAIRNSGDAASLHMADVIVAARQRTEAAFAAAGPELTGLLIDVCGFLKGLEQIEGERGWPRRSAKIVLIVGLRALSRHYGLEAAAVGSGRRQPLRHWGTDDYRPTLSPPAVDSTTGD
jgi:hypothetical protein